MKPAHGLDRPLHGHLRTLRKNLLPALAGHVEALHRTRVASRRLREALPLVGCGLAIDVDKTRGRLQRLTRALGGVRELDVALGVIDEIRRTRASQQVAVGMLRQHILVERDVQRERMLGRLAAMDTEKLDRQLADLERALRGKGASDAWRETLATRIQRRAEGVRAAVDRASALYLSDRVHLVRVAIKKLRYALELSDPTGAARAPATVRQLKQVQDTLGRLHDLEVLRHHVRGVQAAADPRQPWIGDLGIVTRDLEDECRRLHARYIADRARLLKACQIAAEVAGRSRCRWKSPPVPTRSATEWLVGCGGDEDHNGSAFSCQGSTVRKGTRHVLLKAAGPVEAA